MADVRSSDPVSIVVSIRDNARQLPEFVVHLEKLLRPIHSTFELILVNDASQDGSWDVICSLASGRPWIRGIHLTNSFGREKALSVGLDHVRHGVCVSWNAELADPFEVASKLISALDTPPEDRSPTTGAAQHKFDRSSSSSQVTVIRAKTARDETGVPLVPPASGSTRSVPKGLAQRFEPVRILGRGGMGIVYLARDQRLGREVALKLISLENGTKISGFEDEGRLLAALEHENIVRLYDAGVDEGVPYLVMEYVRGPTLQARLAQGRATIIEAVRTVAQVAKGLEQAHSVGIVHRDVKPANIFLDHAGKAKVADFGVGFRVAGQGPGKSLIVGTPAYMSIEQLAGGEVGPASDVYSTGLILYEMVTGRPPVLDLSPKVPTDLGQAASSTGADTDLGRIARLDQQTEPAPSMDEHNDQDRRNDQDRKDDASETVTSPPRSWLNEKPDKGSVETFPRLGRRHVPPASQINPTVPRVLDDLISRALAKDPHARPTASELATSLERWLERAVRRPAVSGRFDLPREPYKPLAALTPEDAPLFFGRDSETTELLEAIESPSLRLLFVFGPCGIGKSSLLRAGLFPQLDATRYSPQIVLGGCDPAGAIRETVASLAALRGVTLADSRPVTAAELQLDPRLLVDIVASIGRAEGRTLVLILDQTEELFTLNPRNSPRIADFSTTVERLVGALAIPFKLVVSYRTEFRGEFFALEERLARHQRSFALAEADTQGLAEAIDGPARVGAYGFTFEEGLPYRLATDILATTRSRGDTAFPIMQIVCHQLYRKAKEKGLTVIDAGLYESAIGGVSGALLRYVEERLESEAYATHRGLARQLIRALTLKEEAGDRFSRPLDEEELLSFPDKEAARATLERLLADHLVLRETAEGGSRRIRLTSEVICPLVDQWVMEPDETERAARLLARAFRQWVDNGRRPDDFMARASLSLVESHRGALRNLSNEERRYLDASLSRARLTAIRRALFAGVVGLILMVCGYRAFLKPGQLVLDSFPQGARVVEVSHRFQGTTPLFKELSPGIYELTLEKELHQPTRMTVKVPVGGEARYSQILHYPFGLLSVSSSPERIRCEIRKSGSAPIAAPSTKRPNSSVDPEKPLTAPWTPFTVELPAGSYDLFARVEGYDTFTKTKVQIPPNKTLVHVSAQLERNTGRLKVLCQENEVSMIVARPVRDPESGNDAHQRVGQYTIPLTKPLDLSPGPYLLQWSKPGHVTSMAWTQIVRGQTTIKTAWTPPVRVLWKTFRGSALRTTPALGRLSDGGFRDVVVVDRDGTVSALAGSTGTLLGSFTTTPTSDPAWGAESSPVLADLDGDGFSEIIVGTPTGAVDVYSMKRRAFLWHFSAGGPIYSSPALADLDSDGVPDVIVGSDDGTVYALSGTAGRLLWKSSVGDAVRSSPAVADLDADKIPDVVVGSLEGRLAALSGRTGVPIWTCFSGNSKGKFRSSPCLGDFDGDGTPDVGFISGDGNITILSGKNGAGLCYLDGNPLVTAPDMGDLDGDGKADVVAGTTDGHIRVASVRTRPLSRSSRLRELWTQKTDGPIVGVSAQVDLDGDGLADVIACSRAGTVSAFKGRGGRPLWTVSGHTPIVAPPIVGDLTGEGLPAVLIACQDGSIQALSGRVLPTVWATETGRMIRSTPPMADLNGDSAVDVVTWMSDQRMAALSGRNGQPLWSVEAPSETGGVFPQTDFNGDGVCDFAGYLGALLVGWSGKDGREIFRDGPYEFGREFTFRTLAAGPGNQCPKDGVVASWRIVDRSRGMVLKHSGVGGRTIWRAEEIGHPIHTVLADMDRDSQLDAVVTANSWPGGGQGLIVLSGKTGQILRKLPTEANGFVPAAVGDLDADGVPDAVAAANDGLVTAFSGQTGERFWTYSMGGPWLPGLATADLDHDKTDDVVVAQKNGITAALSGRTGRPIWTSHSAELTGARPEFFDVDSDKFPDVLVRSTDGFTSVLSGRTGRCLMKLDMLAGEPVPVLVDASWIHAPRPGATTGPTPGPSSKERSLGLLSVQGNGTTLVLSLFPKPMVGLSGLSSFVRTRSGERFGTKTGLKNSR